MTRINWTSDRFRRLMRDHGTESAVVLLPEVGPKSKVKAKVKAKAGSKPKPTGVSDWQLACRYCDGVITVRSTLQQMLEATIRCLHCKESAAGARWRR